MHLIALFGIVLQVAGLWIAIRGVARTYRDTQGSSLRRDVWSEARIWLRRVVLRRRDVQHVEVGAALGSHVSVHTPGVALVPSPPGGDATADEWISYLYLKTEQLDREVEEARRYAEEVASSAEKRLTEQLAHLEEQVSKVDSVARAAHAATIGPDGAGLRETAVGLAITGVGVALTATGLPWQGGSRWVTCAPENPGVEATGSLLAVA